MTRAGNGTKERNDAQGIPRSRDLRHTRDRRRAARLIRGGSQSRRRATRAAGATRPGRVIGRAEGPAVDIRAARSAVSVADRFDDSISVIDLERAELTATIAFGPAPALDAAQRGSRAPRRRVLRGARLRGLPHAEELHECADFRRRPRRRARSDFVQSAFAPRREPARPALPRRTSAEHRRRPREVPPSARRAARRGGARSARGVRSPSVSGRRQRSDRRLAPDTAPGPSRAQLGRLASPRAHSPSSTESGGTGSRA